jgi:hypothetical protein
MHHEGCAVRSNRFVGNQKDAALIAVIRACNKGGSRRNAWIANKNGQRGKLPRYWPLRTTITAEPMPVRATKQAMRPIPV